MKYLVLLYILLVAVFLTVLTQTGGIIYIISWVIYLVIRKRIEKRYWKVIVRLSIFIGLYFITVFLVIPPFAKMHGRVPLPLYKTNHIQPVTIWTALLNRNYVRVELKNVVYSVASEMNKKYPGTVMNYMDAGFPFLKFPLLPHITHDDGKKLDVAFFYTDKTGKQTDGNPSPIGYGGSEPPRKGETDRPSVCASQGYWIYSYMYRVMPLSEELRFDQARTRDMINLFSSNANIRTLYLEPHLKERLNLTSKKIRLHACYSVRHDDHVHVTYK